MKLLACYIALFALVAVTADLGYGRSVYRLMHEVANGDKIAHFVMMGGLAFLVNRAWLARASAGRGAVLAAGTAFCLLLATADEFSHALLPLRMFSYYDLAANYAGIAVLGFVPFVAGPALRRIERPGAPAGSVIAAQA
ncbi:hypothetical protein Mal64_29420 [Pseudobythopirellula maris]|uniref:VanZ-like domain-containing protein n=1 Tax=Pseudobythopirellula maris TaxID=2527991 RepID=A0A5C5ZLT5_9BACT|nr:VanZ family protein [Pseudobythopirellula maris]TWT87403.1 hypothetical protein Mal64_29420 [Pseudobythopirellula maris]